MITIHGDGTIHALASIAIVILSHVSCSTLFMVQMMGSFCFIPVHNQQVMYEKNGTNEKLAVLLCAYNFHVFARAMSRHNMLLCDVQ